MEPRPCSRGNGGRNSARELYPSLQWSHGLAAVETRRVPLRSEQSSPFNGATALQPWKLRLGGSIKGGTDGLQWSHGLAAVETGEVERGQRSLGVPSMEPRPCSRGNAGRVAGLGRRVGPSMEPRPCSRGNAGWSRKSRPRRSPSMEPRPCSRGNHRGHLNWIACGWVLQWSHGLAAVETRIRQPRAVGPGQPSMEPRPCSRGNLQSACWKLGVDLPSMEPRPCSRGNLGMRLLLNPSCGAFNGATALQPWKLLIAAIWSALKGAFNGATALQPWKRSTVSMAISA